MSVLAFVLVAHMLGPVSTGLYYPGIVLCQAEAAARAGDGIVYTCEANR